jgi:AcrR family transcriptional regulator
MARRRPPDRLEQILDAATRVFARTGLEGSKMSDVAEEAGVSQGTLYNYVESKEALFRLLLDRGLGTAAPVATAFPLRSPPAGALAQRMEEAIEATFALPLLDAALARRRSIDARAELTGVVDELFDRTLATRQAADMLERSARDVPELAAVFYGKIRRGLLQRITTLVERRMQSGHYDRRDPGAMARLIVETVTTFARHIYRDVEPPEFDLATARPDIVSALVAGIVCADPPGRGRRRA